MEAISDSAAEEMDFEKSKLTSEVMVYLINLRDGKSVSEYSSQAVKIANNALTFVEQNTNKYSDESWSQYAAEGAKFVAAKIVDYGSSGKVYQFTTQ